MRPRPQPRCRRSSRASSGLREHVDGVHRALLIARPTAGAPVVVELVSVSDSELDHGVLRTRSQAAVTLDAVAARKTPGRFKGRLRLGQSAGDLAETLDTLLRCQLGLLPAGRVAEEPGVQHVERNPWVFLDVGTRGSPQPRVDVAGGLLA